MAAEKPKHGGARPGAGRKPKPKSPTAIPAADLAAALAAPVPDDIASIAAIHAGAALRTLAVVVQFGTPDSARIDACIAILDRGYGKPTVEAGGAPMPPFLGRAPVRLVANEVRDEACRLAVLAVEVLHKIQENGSTDASRVRAARALLDRSFGTVTRAKLPAGLTQSARPMGKKDDAVRGAKAAATGRFAPPRAPSRTVQ